MLCGAGKGDGVRVRGAEIEKAPADSGSTGALFRNLYFCRVVQPHLQLFAWHWQPLPQLQEHLAQSQAPPQVVLVFFSLVIVLSPLFS